MLIERSDHKISNSNKNKSRSISNSNKRVYVRVDLRQWEKGREREIRNYKHRREKRRRRRAAWEELRDESHRAGRFEEHQIGASPSPFSLNILSDGKRGNATPKPLLIFCFRTMKRKKNWASSLQHGLRRLEFEAHNKCHVPSKSWKNNSTGTKSFPDNGFRLIHEFETLEWKNITFSLMIPLQIKLGGKWISPSS